MLLKKDDVNGRKATLQGERLISVPPASFPGASDEPLHSLSFAPGLLCDAKSLGVTLAPLQSTILQSVFTLFHSSIAIKSSINGILSGDELLLSMWRSEA